MDDEGQMTSSSKETRLFDYFSIHIFRGAKTYASLKVLSLSFKGHTNLPGLKGSFRRSYQTLFSWLFLVFKSCLLVLNIYLLFGGEESTCGYMGPALLDRCCCCCCCIIVSWKVFLEKFLYDAKFPLSVNEFSQ